MAMKLKKSDLAIKGAGVMVALILTAVLAGLAACQSPTVDIDLGGTETLTMDTCPTGGSDSTLGVALIATAKEASYSGVTVSPGTVGSITLTDPSLAGARPT